MTPNQKLASCIKKSRVDGPTLLIQWHAPGNDPKTPGTYYSARVAVGKEPVRFFRLFMPAPTNSRASVKVALINDLEGFTQRHPLISCVEVPG